MKIRLTKEIEVKGIGKAIKKARERDPRPLTLICALAGMTTANWYRIEKEDAKVLPAETLRKIETVLGVTFGVNFND